MDILIVGNGGREHALLWKLRRDAPDATFHATRPNGGMADHAHPVDLAPTDVQGLASWAEGAGIDLAVVGPETPLAAGVVDRLQERGVPAFGPSAEAARIESSKAFAKDLMHEAGVPTSSYRVFRELEPTLAHLRNVGAPTVVKASGLAGGKGSLVCETLDEAEDAAREIMAEGAFGDAGDVVVVEAFMEGEELSVFALTDGERAIPLLPSQDHKQVGEGDAGPNTGGMGAYSPVSLATPELLRQVQDEVLLPTLQALARRGSPFRGLLYAGLMLTDQGPKVVEFNCRFGDPEAQVVLPLLADSILEPLTTVAEGGSLEGYEPAYEEGAALITVLASDGYPRSYETGFPMEIPEELRNHPEILLFHAGTRRDDDGVIRTDGGRVLGVTGLGPTLSDAAERSRQGARAVDFEGKRFRSDIGWKEFARDESARP